MDADVPLEDGNFNCLSLQPVWLQRLSGVARDRDIEDFAMRAQFLLNLLNLLCKRDKMRGLPSILSLFATSLINSIIQEQEC